MSDIDYAALGRAVAAAIEGAEDKSQLTREDLKGMAPADIMAAKAAGRCDEMLGIGKYKPKPPESEEDDGIRQYTRADLKGLKPHQIEAARKAGRLKKIMGVPMPTTEN